MTLPIHPGRDLLRALTYSSKWSPRFFSQSTTTATGASLDLALAAYPLHEFELTYAFLRDGLVWGEALAGLEFRTMMGFHLQIGGTQGRFLYRNPDDRHVFRNRIGVGDGATTAFTLTRTFGANGYAGSEPVGQVDLGEPFDVYLGGSAAPTAPALYALNTASPLANTITFTNPPAAGAAVEVDMAYLYYCRLADDANSFERFMDRLWKLGKVTIQSCRPGA